MAILRQQKRARKFLYARPRILTAARKTRERHMGALNENDFKNNEIQGGIARFQRIVKAGDLLSTKRKNAIGASRYLNFGPKAPGAGIAINTHAGLASPISSKGDEDEALELIQWARDLSTPVDANIFAFDSPPASRGGDFGEYFHD